MSNFTFPEQPQAASAPTMIAKTVAGLFVVVLIVGIAISFRVLFSSPLLVLKMALLLAVVCNWFLYWSANARSLPGYPLSLSLLNDSNALPTHLEPTKSFGDADANPVPMGAGIVVLLLIAASLLYPSFQVGQFEGVKIGLYVRLVGAAALAAFSVYFLFKAFAGAEYVYHRKVAVGQPFTHAIQMKRHTGRISETRYCQYEDGPHMWWIHFGGTLLTLLCLLWVSGEDASSFVAARSGVDTSSIPTIAKKSPETVSLDGNGSSKSQPTTATPPKQTSPPAKNPAPTKSSSSLGMWFQIPGSRFRIALPKGATVRRVALAAEQNVSQMFGWRTELHLAGIPNPVTLDITQLVYQATQKPQRITAILNFEVMNARKSARIESGKEFPWQPGYVGAETRELFGSTSSKERVNFRWIGLQDGLQVYRVMARWMPTPNEDPRLLGQIMNSMRVDPIAAKP